LLFRAIPVITPLVQVRPVHTLPTVHLPDTVPQVDHPIRPVLVAIFVELIKSHKNASSGAIEGVDVVDDAQIDTRDRRVSDRTKLLLCHLAAIAERNIVQSTCDAVLTTINNRADSVDRRTGIRLVQNECDFEGSSAQDGI
jgi:hypothetical protein